MNSLTGPHSYARTGDGGSRAERLLAAMHKVFSHDLPNQLVVVQSLLSLLQLEDEANLSQDGKEHLARLRGAAGRAGLLVDFLKEMARLSRLRENREDVL